MEEERNSLKERVLEQDKKLNMIMDAMGIKEKKEEKVEIPVPKKWKAPFRMRSGAKRKIKKKQILVYWLYNNKSADAEWCQTDGTVFYDKTLVPRAFSAEDVILWEGKTPMIMVRESDAKCLSFRGESQRTESIEVADLVIKGIEKERDKMEAKKGWGGFMWILIIGGLILAGYLVYQYITKKGVA